MSNPLRQIRMQPWIPLMQVALLTAFWVFFLELLLWFGFVYVPLVRDAVSLLYEPPLGLIIEIAAACGVGAFAVWVLETVCPQVVINGGVLWALVPCLVVLMMVKTLLPVPSVLITPNQVVLIGILLGVFWRGRPYW